MLSPPLSTCYLSPSPQPVIHAASEKPANGTVPIPLPPTFHSSQQVELYTSHSHPHLTAASKWNSVHIPLPPTLHSSQQMELYTSHSHPHFTAARKWDCTPPTPTHTLQQPANGTVHIPSPPTFCSSQQMELCTHPAATLSDV